MMTRQQRRHLEREMARVADRMMTWAKTWEFDGRKTPMNALQIDRSRVVHEPSSTVLIFTRDTGHHSSGWLRNPDYERCWHLSMSPIPGWILSPYAIEPDRHIQRMWCEAFFGPHLHLAWTEGPKSSIGHRYNVWHWRVFADERWEPILPRDEVYSHEFTELGWKSASEVFELEKSKPDVLPGG